MYTFALGFATGVLVIMQAQVIAAWRKKRYNPLLKNPNFIPLEQRVADLDWHISELDKATFIPTPREEVTPRVPALQECPHCGRGYKRVAQHIRMAHKTPVMDE